VLAKKHTKHLTRDTIALGVERMSAGSHRDGPTDRRLARARSPGLACANVIYAAFIGRWDADPKHLAKVVHQHYFAPAYPEFEPRTMWSLQNAFTSAFKNLDPIPQSGRRRARGFFLTASRTEEARWNCVSSGQQTLLGGVRGR